MDWISLSSETELTQLIERSHTTAQVIYKHSTSCGTSFLVKEMLDESTAPENAVFYMLNLIVHRALSNQIASLFKVRHESPQILVIKNGICIYHKSHSGIRMQTLQSALSLPQ